MVKHRKEMGSFVSSLRIHRFLSECIVNFTIDNCAQTHEQTHTHAHNTYSLSDPGRLDLGMVWVVAVRIVVQQVVIGWAVVVVVGGVFLVVVGVDADNVHAPTKPYTSSTRISKSPETQSGGLLNVWQRSVLPKRMFSSIQIACP